MAVVCANELDWMLCLNERMVYSERKREREWVWCNSSISTQTFNPCTIHQAQQSILCFCALSSNNNTIADTNHGYKKARPSNQQTGRPTNQPTNISTHKNHLAVTTWYNFTSSNAIISFAISRNRTRASDVWCCALLDFDFFSFVASHYRTKIRICTGNNICMQM